MSSIRSTRFDYSHEIATTVYSYQGEIRLGYTSCFGNKKGQYVGSAIALRSKKADTFYHLSLGGDSNYDEANHSEQARKNNFENKYPVVKRGFIEFGNHEYGIERFSTGRTKETTQLLNVYNPVNSDKAFITYASKDKITPAPHAEIFEKNGQSTFCIIHIDSDIFTFNTAYQNKIIKLINNIASQHKNIPIVLSHHHAPDTYGRRRSDKNDALKYLEHQKKFHGLPEQDVSHGLAQIKPTKDKQELNKQRLSNGSYNNAVRLALENIYAQTPNANIIATQSGHDHFAGLMPQPNGKLAILQGNGAQEAIRFFNSSQQQAYKKFTTIAKKDHKLFGIDDDRSEYDAKYLRLGFGEWTINAKNQPVYTQYYFSQLDPSRKDNKLIVGTVTTFNSDGYQIQDYLTGKRATINKDSTVPTVVHPMKRFHSVGVILTKNKRIISPSLVMDLQQSVIKDSLSYRERIINEYEKGQLSFKTLVKLNRLAHVNEKSVISKKSLETAIGTYDKAEKGFVRWLKGDSTTVLHFKKLLKLQNNSNDFKKSDLDLIIELQKRRRSRFSFSNCFAFFFNKHKKTNTEVVIESIQEVQPSQPA